MVNDERVEEPNVIRVSGAGGGIPRGSVVAIGLGGDGKYEYAFVKATSGGELTVTRMHWWRWVILRARRIARSAWTRVRLGAEWVVDAVRGVTQAR
jgi:hypothetical protein